MYNKTHSTINILEALRKVSVVVQTRSEVAEAGSKLKKVKQTTINRRIFIKIGVCVRKGEHILQ